MRDKILSMMELTGKTQLECLAMISREARSQFYDEVRARTENLIEGDYYASIEIIHPR